MSFPINFPRRPFLLRLPADLHVRLKAVASLRGMSASAVACRGLEIWVNMLQDQDAPGDDAGHDDADDEQGGDEDESERGEDAPPVGADQR